MRSSLQLIFLSSVIVLILVMQKAQSEPRFFTTQAVNENGVVGQLYVPENISSSMVVLVLGGSSGRLNQAYSERLASNGITALSLAYFNVPGLPQTLDDVPIETVSRALDYIEKQPQITHIGFGILAISRGTELAFLSAIHEPRITSLAAIVPTSVAWHGQTGPHAWTWQNRQLPSLSFERQSELSTYQRAEAALASKAAQQAQFEFEKINGPILLISAKIDHIWPSTPMANQIVAYLKTHDFNFSVQHISVDDNHFIDSKNIDGFEHQLINHFKP